MCTRIVVRFSFASLPLLVLLFAGCRSQAIDDKADKELFEARAESEIAFVYPACPPYEPARPNCGLIVSMVSTPYFREKFREKKCAQRTEESCERLYQKAVDAWLAQRYSSANFKAVALACDANPGECDDSVKYELRLLDSHNEYVRNQLARSERAIEAERRAAQAEHAANIARTVDGVMDELQYEAHRGPKCRTYPSIFSGSRIRFVRGD